ncbi:alpha/beta fold hydrolase [Nonomuraea guangzhouensis]|uniref:Alpha/beta fold hydrolase n=1 Tax=Nonomuraea guangzhouensis TaxID=1291555 RepID=A0ABW4G667_9ACTN|nr:alpha/beta fold hydrolase [Nonomuraea guangzhouensis]
MNASSNRYAEVAHVMLRRPHTPASGTMLLLHGLGGDTTQFAPFLPHLARLPCDLLIPDMRAHGLTPLIGDASDFTFQRFSADIAALLRTRAIQPPLIGVGISMGAGVLAALALHSPGALAGLVFIRPAWEDQADPPHLRAFSTIAGLLATRDGAAEFARSPVYRAVRAESATVADSLMDQFGSPHAAERRLRLERMPLSTPFAELADLRRIRTPATVIGTRHDPLHPLTIARRWAGACGTALHVVPPKSAHDDRYIAESAAIITAVAGQALDNTSS